VIRALLKYTYTGEKPEGIPEEYLLYITQKEASALHNKWVEIVSSDMEVLNVEGRSINDFPVGEQLEILPDEFTELIISLKKEQKKAPKDTTPYAKIAKAVKATDAALWAECLKIFEAAEIRRKAEIEAKKHNAAKGK
jgi:hypothetical protein